MRRGEHTCRVVDGPEAYRTAALGHLAEGLARGERLLYLADRAPADLAADLAPLADVDRLLARGALAIQSTSEVYAHAPFEAATQVAHFRALGQAALDDGYTGLRVAADVTALVVDDDDRRRFMAYELAVDRLMVTAPIFGMCAYDLAILGHAAGDMCAVHPIDDAPAELAPGFRLCFAPHGLALSGAIDMANHELFTTALESAAACVDAEVVIDAAGLAFIDVRGLVMLARFRDELVARGGDLRVTNPPSTARRCASVLEIDPGLFASPGAAA